MKPPPPVKSRGQHFLKDSRVVHKIVDLLDLAQVDTLVEIGPGRGALTGALLATGKRVVAIEPDGRMIAYLESQFESPPQLLHQSVLDVDAGSLLKRNERAALLGNLPYNLSGPILEWIFQSASSWRQVVLMLQLEVARRLVAPPDTRDFGPLAVACALHFRATKRFPVRPGAFFPPPAVMSAVVELVPARPPVRVKDQAAFMRLVHVLFAHRRKNIRNNLLAAPVGESANWDDVLASAPLDGRLRAEQLQWQDLERLYAAARRAGGLS